MSGPTFFQSQQTREHGSTTPADDPLSQSDAELLAALNAEYPVPRFRFERRLGYGGCARALAVYDRQTKRLLAYKFAANSDPGARNELEREVQALSLLNHPNIPPLHDHGHLQGGLTWLCMPVLAGSTLLTRPPRGSWRERCAALLPVAEALQHAHEHGICHGDVAPGNIMQADDGSVHLLDWGSASLPGLPAEVSRCTPASAAPERLAGSPPSPASDIFACASVIHERLRDLRLPRPARRVFAKARASAAEDRYPNMAALLADLRALVVDEAPSVSPEGPVRKLWRWTRRSPVTALGSLALLLCLLALTTLLYRNWQMQSRAWHEQVQTDFQSLAEPERWSSRAYPDWNLAEAVPVPVQGEQAIWTWQPGSWQAHGSVSWMGTVTLRSPWQVSGDFEISWQVRPLHNGQNCNAWIGTDRFSGWTLHIGGFEDQTSIALTDGRLGMETFLVGVARLPQPLAVGQAHEIRWRFVGPEIGVWVNGSEQLRYRDPLYAGYRSAQAFGWEASRNQLRIETTRITRLQRSLQVSALELPDYLFAQERYAEALEQYRAIPTSSLPPAEQVRLRFQLSRCRWHTNDPQSALRQWRQMVADQELTPDWRGAAAVLLSQHNHHDSALAAAAALPAWARRVLLDRQIYVEWQHVRLEDMDTPSLQAAMTDFLQRIQHWQQQLKLPLAALHPLHLPNRLLAYANLVANYGMSEQFATTLSKIHPHLGRLAQQADEPIYEQARILQQGGQVLARSRALIQTPPPALPLHAGPYTLAQLDHMQLQLGRERRARLVTGASPDELLAVEARYAEIPPSNYNCPQQRAFRKALFHLTAGRRDVARAVLLAASQDPAGQAWPRQQQTLECILSGSVTPEYKVHRLWLPIALALQADIAGQEQIARMHYQQALDTLPPDEEWRLLARYRLAKAQ